MLKCLRACRIGDFRDPRDARESETNYLRENMFAKVIGKSADK